MGKPRIRFKGFDNDWEQRKFSEFVNNVARKNKDNLDLEPYAVTNDRGFIAQKDAHDDFGYMKETDRRAYNIVPPNSFAYNPARINVGSLGYYTGSENVIVSSLYEVFQTEDYIDDRFLWHWLKSNHFPKWIEKLQEGSVRLYFYFDKLVQCQMMVPTIKEQKQISTYFDSIDHLITLHQRKCEDTKKLKKYMLQKMFPQNVSKVPEIRFKGFTDDWEQRKVSDVAKIIAGGTPSTKENSYWEPKEIPWLSSGEVHKKYITFTDDMISQIGMNNSSAKMVAKDSVLIALAGQGKTRGTVAINRIPLTTNQSIAAMTFNEDFIPEFVFYNLENRYDELRRMSSGDGSRGGLNKQLVGDIEIPYTEKEEQERIGSFFESLDNLITLHQNKCDELKKIKKYMLQNMFV